MKKKIPPTITVSVAPTEREQFDAMWAAYGIDRTLNVSLNSLDSLPVNLSYLTNWDCPYNSLSCD